MLMVMILVAAMTGCSTYSRDSTQIPYHRSGSLAASLGEVQSTYLDISGVQGYQMSTSDLAALQTRGKPVASRDQADLVITVTTKPLELLGRRMETSHDSGGQPGYMIIYSTTASAELVVTRKNGAVVNRFRNTDARTYEVGSRYDRNVRHHGNGTSIWDGILISPEGVRRYEERDEPASLAKLKTRNGALFSVVQEFKSSYGDAPDAISVTLITSTGDSSSTTLQSRLAAAADTPAKQALLKELTNQAAAAKPKSEDWMMYTNNIGAVHVSMGDYDQALVQFRRITESSGFFTAPFYTNIVTGNINAANQLRALKP